jgi:hypothetical protein
MLLKKRYLWIVVFVLNTTILAANNTDFEKNYFGKIGTNLDVTFHLNNTNGSISGFYYYNKIGVDIKIVGSIDNKMLKIFELGIHNDTIALMKCFISDSKIEGNWISLKTKKQYHLDLTVTSAEIVALPQKIEGSYKSEDCNIEIIIKKERERYYYTFISEIRTLKGEISLKRNDRYNEIILEGIEYAEDYFDVGLPEENPEYEELKKDGNRRVGIDCFLDSDKITIENYGNAMNYYLKLRDCGNKYIVFSKQ